MIDARAKGTLSGEGLACARGGRLVFAHLDFSLRPGGLLLLQGPNGSGKSSLLRLIAGLAPVHSGHLRWDGADVGDDAEAHAARLIFVGHLDAVKPQLTVFETLRFWTRLRDPAIDVGLVRAALDRLALGDLADVPARLLSAGQRRRLALSRLLTSPAPLWLLDEPANALDEESEARLAGIVAEHRAGGGMAVIATHAALDMPDASRLRLGGLAA
jgi:heme exporter protein A